MAVERKYAEQMPWVGTATQKAMIEKEADERRISKAQIVREAIDKRYGLVDGEEVADTAEVRA